MEKVAQLLLDRLAAAAGIVHDHCIGLFDLRQMLGVCVHVQHYRSWVVSKISIVRSFSVSLISMVALSVHAACTVSRSSIERITQKRSRYGGHALSTCRPFIVVYANGRGHQAELSTSNTQRIARLHHWADWSPRRLRHFATNDRY